LFWLHSVSLCKINEFILLLSTHVFSLYLAYPTTRFRVPSERSNHYKNVLKIIRSKIHSAISAFYLLLLWLTFNWTWFNCTRAIHSVWIKFLGTSRCEWLWAIAPCLNEPLALLSFLSKLYLITYISNITNIINKINITNINVQLFIFIF